MPYQSHQILIETLFVPKTDIIPRPDCTFGSASSRLPRPLLFVALAVLPSAGKLQLLLFLPDATASLCCYFILLLVLFFFIFISCFLDCFVLSTSLVFLFFFFLWTDFLLPVIWLFVLSSVIHFSVSSPVYSILYYQFIHFILCYLSINLIIIYLFISSSTFHSSILSSTTDPSTLSLSIYLHPLFISPSPLLTGSLIRIC